MTGDSGRDEWLRQARAYLRDADPVLARLIEDRPDFDPRAWLAQLPPMDLFGALLFQVTGQQLSVAATRRILARIGTCSAAASPPPPNCSPPTPPPCAPRDCPGARSPRCASWPGGWPTAGWTRTR